MKMPELINYQLTEDKLELTLSIPPSLFWFKGHFPQQAILPGVIQVSWILHYARHYWGIKGALKGIDVMKFQHPLFPGQTVNLLIERYKETNKLSFQYQLANNQIISYGRMVLCPS